MYRAAPDLQDRVKFERFVARPDVYLSGERARRLADELPPIPALAKAVGA